MPQDKISTPSHIPGRLPVFALVLISIIMAALLLSACAPGERAAVETVAAPSLSSGNDSSDPLATAVSDQPTLVPPSGRQAGAPPLNQAPKPLNRLYLPSAYSLTSPSAGIPNTLVSERVENMLNEMSLEEKVGQLILTGITDVNLTDADCTKILRMQPAGITFQWYNVIDPDQMQAFVQAIQECAAASSSIPMLFTLAHEGEYVYRFNHTVTMFPAALAIAASGDPKIAYDIGYASAQELAASGINMVLGPVADVLLEPDNEVISVRTFGSDPSLVSEYVQNMVSGYHDAGVLTVLKHFPGHGGVVGDSHKLLPVDDASAQDIRQFYLPPFQAGLDAGAEIVMLSHVAYPAISGESLPATISPAVIALLRSELGFQGPILSDHLKMKAISGGELSVAQASLAAVNAGVDLLLLNEPEEAAESYAYLLAAAGDGGMLSEGRLNEAVRRILYLKAAAGLPAPSAGSEQIDWNQHQQLAYQVGQRAVTLLRDETGLLPVSKTYQTIQLAGPVSDEFEFFYERLAAELRSAGFAVKQGYLTLGEKGIESSQEMIDTFISDTNSSDLVLYFTYQAHLLRITREDTWQVVLGNRLLESGKPVIFIALRSPTDLLEFSQAKTFLATFGTTAGQLDALMDVLLRGRQPPGVNPLPELK